MFSGCALSGPFLGLIMIYEADAVIFGAHKYDTEGLVHACWQSGVVFSYLGGTLAWGATGSACPPPFDFLGGHMISRGALWGATGSALKDTLGPRVGFLPIWA